MLDGIIYDVHMKELITKCYIKKDLLQRFLFSEPIPGISLASAWWAFVLKYDPQKTICKRFLFLTVYKKAEQLYTKQQVTRNNKWFNEWQRMTPSGTSGKEWHNEWLTTSGPTSDNHCKTCTDIARGMARFLWKLSSKDLKGQKKQTTPSLLICGERFGHL